jgi:hypothetical protein
MPPEARVLLEIAAEVEVLAREFGWNFSALPKLPSDRNGQLDAIGA